MNTERFNAWLRNIYATQDEEISCSECFDLISHFVELETSGQDAQAQMPKVKQHIDQCRACREEYVVLRDLVDLDNQGNTPSLDDLMDTPR